MQSFSHHKCELLPSDMERVKAFTEQIETLVKQNRLEFAIAEQLLGEEAYPDTILPIAESIQATRPIEGSLLEAMSNEDGPSLIQGALNVTKSQAQKFLKDPKTASVLFRSLRDKLEEMEDKKVRAAAEEHGFIATVIYTIKKAMTWLIKKFHDLKDDFKDMIAERPAGSSRTKSDYLFIRNKEEDYLANNTDWFLNSEH